MGRKTETGAAKPEKIEAEASGELFELDMELCLAVEAFRNGQPIVTGEEARKRILICLAAERALAEGREMKLDFSRG